MRVVSLGQSQESSTLVELRGTRVLLDAGLSLAASARLVQREVVVVDDGCEEDSKPRSKKSKSNHHRRKPHTTGQGEFLISAPAYRTAMFEVSPPCLIFEGREKRDGEMREVLFFHSFCFA